jgi:hypothetical protein
VHLRTLSNLAGIVFCAGASTACGYSVTTLPETEAPENVETVAPAIVSRSAPPPGAQKLGRVDARKCFYGSVAACHERLGAEAAARLGANYVQLVDDGDRVTWCAWAAPYCVGVAYRSASLPQAMTGAQAEPSDGGGCTKDTDCKGNRICSAGQCVEPSPRTKR